LAARRRSEGDPCAWFVTGVAPLRLDPLRPRDSIASRLPNPLIPRGEVRLGASTTVIGRATAAEDKAAQACLADPRLSREHVRLEHLPGQPPTATAVGANPVVHIRPGGGAKILTREDPNLGDENESSCNLDLGDELHLVYEAYAPPSSGGAWALLYSFSCELDVIREPALHDACATLVHTAQAGSNY
jgi:hypothetical protein